MSEARTVRAYDYVNQPYEPVRDAIGRDAKSIFERATHVAEQRSESIAGALSVDIAGIEVRKNIDITILSIEEDKPASGGALSRVTHVKLEWQASESAKLFPLMHADLRIYPLSHTETQVELVGEYDPPMGVLGTVVDAIAGHRIAEASVHRFVRSLVEQLRADLA
jgi:hypothetical protein